jgi:hypothetical protein
LQLVLSLLLAISAAETWKGPFADHKLGQVVEDTPEVAAAKLRHIETLEAIRAALPELPVEAEDHIAQARRGPLSQAVEDTPEVAAARSRHLDIYTNKQLLPTEDVLMRERMILQQARNLIVPEVAPVRPVESTTAQTAWTGPYADHKLGQNVEDTAEVAAARKLHSEVYAKVRSVLPELPREDSTGAEDVAVKLTPEVSDAVKAYLLAYQEAVNLLEPSTTTVAPPVQPLVHWGQVPADTPEVAAAKLEHARAFAAALGH